MTRGGLSYRYLSRISTGFGRCPSSKEILKTFGTTTRELVRLSEWLTALGVTHVAMESTGVYWKPVHYILEGNFTILVVNPASIKNVGHKTDVRDARWIAQLLECDLLRGSYIPPPPIRMLRNLTRYRRKVMEQRVEEIQRLNDVLQDAGVMLSSVAGQVRGVSAQAMITAMAEGHTDPDELAEMALGKLRGKKEELRQALDGHFGPTHGLMARELMGHLEHLEGMLDRLNEEINHQLEPYQEEVQLLQTIPGVKEKTTQVIIAELGVNMDPFPSAEQAASWACVCPRGNQSAGKRKAEHVGKRGGGLRPALVQAAWAAVRQEDSYLAAQFHRFAGHMPKKKAILGVAHSILVIAYCILKEHKPYQDLGRDYFLKRNKEAVQKRCIRQLERLGLKVTVEPVAVSGDELPVMEVASRLAKEESNLVPEPEVVDQPAGKVESPIQLQKKQKARKCRSKKPSASLPAQPAKAKAPRPQSSRKRPTRKRADVDEGGGTPVMIHS
jgi:transposase